MLVGFELSAEDAAAARTSDAYSDRGVRSSSAEPREPREAVGERGVAAARASQRSAACCDAIRCAATGGRRAQPASRRGVQPTRVDGSGARAGCAKRANGPLRA
jgi:hypothetical protein